LFAFLFEFCSSPAIWLLIFELSAVTVVASLSIEGRAYRRIFSLLVMLALGLLSTGITVFLLSSSEKPAATEAVAFFLLVLVVVVKVPSFPFSVWLPEAHVEAT
jgi:NADH:ubiquinone oxidoreductase subunit 4 (subunit M)